MQKNNMTTNEKNQLKYQNQKIWKINSKNRLKYQKIKKMTKNDKKNQRNNIKKNINQENTNISVPTAFEKNWVFVRHMMTST